MAVLISGWFFFQYIQTLNHTVREQFAGKRWSIPSRVYANPVELYTGLAMPSEQLVFLLKKLQYRLDSPLSSVATYQKTARRIRLRTRPFDFWDGHQKSQTVEIQFTGTEIQRIIDVDSGRELALLRLDPEQIGQLYPKHKEDRLLVKLDEIPENLAAALVATEDRDFYQHHGISIKGIARAIWVNIREGGFVQGGSTLTQQLVKNFYLSSERKISRKIHEAFMALILEFHFSKADILEAYINEIYLGQDGSYAIHGFGLASEFYFSKPLAALSLHQLASLVALVRGPSYYDLRRHPKRALERRNLVLQALLEQGHITPVQYQQAEQQTLKIVPFAHRAVNRYPAFMDLVKRQLKEQYSDSDLSSNGLRIFTSLESHVQDSLAQSITQQLNQIESRIKVKQLETAAVVTRRGTAEVVALMGGRVGYQAGFNRALNAVRPIGSLVKPFVYLTALNIPEKYTLLSPLKDTAITVKLPQGGQWKPKNYAHKAHGKVPLHTALSHSYNLATVHLGMELGLGRVAKTLKDAGIKRSFELYPSLLLGSLALSPYEVTQMYQTLAGEGFSMPLRSIKAVLTSDGKKLQHYPYTLTQALPIEATYLTNTVLQEVMREGTGKSAYKTLDQHWQLAGKTGTSNDLKDSWFAGFTGDYLSVVWVGRDDAKSAGVTGASGALKIWTAFMNKVAKESVLLSQPDKIEKVWINEAVGLPTHEFCPTAKQYPFIKGSVPKEHSLCLESSLKKATSWLNQLIEGKFE